MRHFNGQGKLSGNLLRSITNFVIFLAFVSNSGVGDCSPLGSSSCPSETNLDLEELPRLILWRQNVTAPLFEKPGDKEIELVGAPDYFDSKNNVKIKQVGITCAAKYPVLLVALMANDSDDEFALTSFIIDAFFVYSLPKLESLKLNLSDRPSLNRSDKVFETHSSFFLSLERNVSVLACAAVDNPCLGSAGKLVFTNHGKSLDAGSQERPKFNFTVKMIKNSLPHRHPFLTSSYRSFPIIDKTANSSKNSTKTGYSIENSSGPQSENSCDAIFYYHLEEMESVPGFTLTLVYACEFSNGSPGFVKIHRCRARGRCMFPRSREKTVKNCWREFSPGESCRNCTKLKIGFNMLEPFVPICVSRKGTDYSTLETPNYTIETYFKLLLKKRDMQDGNRVVKGTPLYVGFPSGFEISQPNIRTWDDDDNKTSGGNERMIRMHVFEEVQMVNSVLQVTCDSSAYYTNQHFNFGFRFQNKSQLNYLVGNDTELRLATLPAGNIFTQTWSIDLNETHLEVERIFCFARVQNSNKSINASRPLRVVPNIQDLFKPGHCKFLNPQLQSHPVLLLKRNASYNPKYVHFDAEIEQQFEFDDAKDQILCQAVYPIELIYNSTYRDPQTSYFKVFNEKYDSHYIYDAEGQIGALNAISTAGFDLRDQTFSQFFRCQSIQDPCLHRSFQFFLRPKGEKNKTGGQVLVVWNFPPREKVQTVQTELGRPANYQECEVLFFYKEILDFPGYEFRCEFPMSQRGTVNFHFCDSMNDCANTWRNRRQSPKCWRKVASWENCESGCGIKKLDEFRPFVATCSFDRLKYQISLSKTDESRYRESTLGSFVVFGLSVKPSEIAPIYFSEDEIPAGNMTFMQPFDPYQFLGQSLDVTCTVSEFFNSAKIANIKFAKYFAHKDKFQVVTGYNVEQSSYNAGRHFWTVTKKIDLGNDTDLSHIYCIGLLWKRSNSSQKIHLHASESPKISLHVSDSDGELTVQERGEIVPADQEQEELFPLSSVNVSLRCHGFGYPPPEISWTTSAANEPNAESTVVNATHSLSTMILPVVYVGVQGTYICTAKNKAGKVSSSVKVGISYPVNKSVVAISSVGYFILLLFVLTLLFFLRRVRKLKQTLRDLSDDEVKQFHFGDKSFDPTDSNAEIYALAYDRSLEVAPDLIEIDEDSLALGAGEFGIVRRGFLKSNDSVDEHDSKLLVAIKMPKFNVTTENFISFLQEIKIMSHVQNHENVLKILGASTVTIKKRQALVALEFCELGDLKNFLRDRKHAYKNEFVRSNLTGGYGDPWALFPKSERLDTVDLLNFSLGIANGMNFLTEKRVIHGDLAARNVLLTGNREVKISDFGFSTQLKNYQTYTKTNSVSIPWRWFSIEALLDRKFSMKSDCWSFGILLYEIFSLGEDPYPSFAELDFKFVECLRGGYRNEKPAYANQKIYDLMTECWQKDPSERPTFTAICDKILDFSVEIVGPKLNVI